MLRALRIMAAVALLFGLVACVNCTELNKHPIIVSASGQKFCARHHIPLITVRGFRAPGNPLVFYHPVNRAQQRVEDCNPNYIYPDHSLYRNKRCPIPAWVTYCPNCEDAYEHEDPGI
jgi:hypothetical protein